MPRLRLYWSNGDETEIFKPGKSLDFTIIIVVRFFFYERLFLFPVILLNVSLRNYLTGVRPSLLYRMSLIVASVVAMKLI